MDGYLYSIDNVYPFFFLFVLNPGKLDFIRKTVIQIDCRNECYTNTIQMHQNLENLVGGYRSLFCLTIMKYIDLFGIFISLDIYLCCFYVVYRHGGSYVCNRYYEANSSNRCSR